MVGEQDELIGYARVSSKGQDLTLQKQALEQAGCSKIFFEKESGKSTANRVELGKALELAANIQEIVASRKVRGKGRTPQIVLVVTKLDRLARSLRDLFNIADDLENRGIGLKILDQQIDTTTPSGKLLFHVLGSLAEFERSLIRERTQAGRERAMAAGVQMGRPPKLSDKDIAKLRAEYNTWTGDKRELAKRWGIGKSTMYRLLGQA